MYVYPEYIITCQVHILYNTTNMYMYNNIYICHSYLYMSQLLAHVDAAPNTYCPYRICTQLSAVSFF